MADLEPLIRYRKNIVEEKQKRVADIYRQIEVLEQEKENLSARLKKEREALEQDLALETRAYYGRFEGVVRLRIQALDEKIRAREKELEPAQEEVRQAFSDMKQVEIVHKKRQEEERKIRSDKETQDLNEIGLETFRRREER